MSTIETTQHLASSLRPLFRMWPAYNVGEGFIQLAAAFWERYELSFCCTCPYRHQLLNSLGFFVCLYDRKVLFMSNRPFDWDVTGRNLVLLYGLAPAYFLILIMLEYSQDGGSGGIFGRFLRWLRGLYERAMLQWYGVTTANGSDLRNEDGQVQPQSSLDEDVILEASFVLGRKELENTAPIVLKNLWKIYPPSAGLFGTMLKRMRHFLGFFCRVRRRDLVGANNLGNSDGGQYIPRQAVRGLTTAITQGETFGLLGANGAGKWNSNR